MGKETDEGTSESDARTAPKRSMSRSRSWTVPEDSTSDLGLDASTLAQLHTFGFDRTQFDRLRARLRNGASGARVANERIRGRVEPPNPNDLLALPPEDSGLFGALEALGRTAIAAGQVGLVILAGGMATRFGGGVKAGVEVFPGRSFLDLKLADAQRVAHLTGGRVPVYLMVSFATSEVVSTLASAATSNAVPIETVAQFVSLRLDTTGEIFRERNGAASPYAPGHGDLTFALRASGALGRFRKAGGRILLVSNVDNLAATLDPVVIGAHLSNLMPATVEVVRAQPGDVGGAPARVDGVLQIVEGFRFPLDFDQGSLPAFNTNTFVLDAAAIDRDFDLSFFQVEKRVDGRVAVQFERLLGEITAFLPTSLLVVPRKGPVSRFEPVKDPGDLERRRRDIHRCLATRGILAGDA